MWKETVLLLTLLTCGIKGGNVHRNEWAHAQQQEVVSQPSYYSQFGPVLHDLASYQHKLYQQGLAPTYEHDLNPPFTLTYEKPLPHNSYQDNYNQGSYGEQQHVPSYYPNQKIVSTSTEGPTKKSTEIKGKPNCNHIVKTGEGSENEHAKKPLHEIDIKRPNIKHDNQNEDKKHANHTLVKDVNETLHKIVDQVEVKLSGIKQLWIDIEKKADNVYQHINDKSKLIDKLNERLNATKQQLEALVSKLKFGTEKSALDESFDVDSTRAIEDNPQQSNVVHSEVGKNLRKLVLSDLGALEQRGDLKNWFSDVFIKPQGSFNKLISEKVTNIGSDVNKLTKEWTEYLKTQLPASKPTPPKVYTPPTYKPTTTKKTTLKPITTTTVKYTTIHWKPKATTAYPKETSKFFDRFTTPDYFKYTVPAKNKFKQETFDTLTDLNRMDGDVDSLKIVDDAKDELAEKDDDKVESEVLETVETFVDTVDRKSDETKAIDEPEIKVDVVKSLDDMQLEVLEKVKGTLETNEDENLEEFDSNLSEAAKNPEDKSESGKIIEAALLEELRNELKDDKLSENDDETSNIDNSRAENSDESTKKLVEIEEDAETKEEDELEEIDDESEKLLEIDDNVDADSDGNEEMSFLDNNETRIADDVEVVTEIGEDSQLTQSNQAENIRFDELEVIQLVPVIIDQLRKGHVSKSEQVALEKVFGDLWPLLLVEAKRAEGEEMNPLLRTILQSEEVRLAKREITKQIGNDIFKNSVRRVYRGDGENSPKPYISLDDDRKLLSPSERLLKMVAAIVHKANVIEKSEAKLRQKRKQKRKNMRKRNQKNPLGIVTVEQPRRRFLDRVMSINRIKRSIVKYTSDLEDMKAYLEQVNQASEFETNNDDESNESNEIDESHTTELGDDYFDDDYLYEDYESMPSDDSDIFSQLGWSGGNNYYDDYENGSVNEFIQLAKQRDRREKSSTHEKFDDESYEDDGDY